MSQYPAPPPAPPYGAPVAPPERVVTGLLYAALAIPVGMVVAVILWRLNFVAGISSFVIAAGAVSLYAKGAGAAPRAGLFPLIGLIVGGVVLSFFSLVVSDLVDVYNDYGVSGQSKAAFISGHLFDTDLVNAYQSRNFIFFVLFAGLGIFGTLRRVVGVR